MKRMSVWVLLFGVVLATGVVADDVPERPIESSPAAATEAADVAESEKLAVLRESLKKQIQILKDQAASNSSEQVKQVSSDFVLVLEDFEARDQFTSSDQWLKELEATKKRYLVNGQVPEKKRSPVAMRPTTPSKPVAPIPPIQPVMPVQPAAVPPVDEQPRSYRQPTPEQIARAREELEPVLWQMVLENSHANGSRNPFQLTEPKVKVNSQEGFYGKAEAGYGVQTKTGGALMLGGKVGKYDVVDGKIAKLRLEGNGRAHLNFSDSAPSRVPVLKLGVETGAESSFLTRSVGLSGGLVGQVDFQRDIGMDKHWDAGLGVGGGLNLHGVLDAIGIEGKLKARTVAQLGAGRSGDKVLPYLQAKGTAQYQLCSTGRHQVCLDVETALALGLIQAGVKASAGVKYRARLNNDRLHKHYLFAGAEGGAEAAIDLAGGHAAGQAFGVVGVQVD